MLGRLWIRRLVMLLVVPGALLAVTAPAASAAGVCSTTTPQYCPAPVVSTGAATSIGTYSATLTGTVNPNGAQTSCFFAYGPAAAGPMQIGSSDPGAGTSPVSVTASLTGLEPKTTFHYILICISAGGLTTGSTSTFTTNDRGPSRVVLTGHTAFVSSSRVASVFLGCYGDRACNGKITLTANGKKIASKKFRLSSNSGGAIKLKLSKTVFDSIKGGLRAKAKVVDVGGRSAFGTITLRTFT